MILFPDFPSHKRGTCPFFHFPENSFDKACSIFLGFEESNSLVPICTVSGRSVLSRKVKHGIFNTVVSSEIPPESVITAFAF